MLTLGELLHEADHLPAADKWRLVKHLLDQLEHEKIETTPTDDYQEFLKRMYGSLSDSPIERWDQGDYEKRESME